jgi:hypothetical protein
VSSIVVEAGLDAFLFERVLDLAIGLDSESWAEECLVAELLVRGGMRSGKNSDACWRVGDADG